MTDFLPIWDVQLLWRHAPILRAAIRTLRYLSDNGPVGLTASMALERPFVEWAAEVFEWPGYGLEELYAVSPALEEHHFPPLVVLHDLLLSTRLARHDQGHLVISGFGRASMRAPAHLWALLARELLFSTDHARYMRENLRFGGDWDMILDVLNLTVDAGASEDQICDALLEGSGIGVSSDPVIRRIIFVHVLRPLTWSGLLADVRGSGGTPDDCVYVKTPLWATALALPSDSEVPGRALH